MSVSSAADEDASGTPTNLAFVCVDCLRADAIADRWGETPYLTSLADNGIEYTGMTATATTTTPCVASAMTGQYSEHNGAVSLREAKLAPGVPTLAERFAAAGYATYATVTGPLVPETDLDRGFDEYWYRPKDESLFGDWAATATERIERFEEPFFWYLHLWELHGPIDVPAGYDDPRYGRWPYERALSALDAALARLLERLSADTAVVVHGDHGESITWRDHPFREATKRARDKLRYERGVDTRRIERVLNRVADRVTDGGIDDHFIEDGHGETVFDHAANVPFVLAGLDGESDRVEALCRQVDVYPTLLDLFDIDDDPAVDGASLLPPSSVSDRPAYVRACGEALRGRANWIRSVRTADAKYVEYPERDWPAELYDLERDPSELAPVDDPIRERVLRRRFPTERPATGERIDIDARLRDLGYL